MRLIIFVTVLQTVNGVISVLKCPFGERGWRIREKKVNCKGDHGLTYHCLLDLYGRSVEVCLERREYRGGGCPWVLQTNEGAFLGSPLTSCKNTRYCPSRSKSFYSNQLYLHPACLVKEEKRLNFTLPDVFHEYITTRQNTASPTREVRYLLSPLFVVSGVLNIVFLLLVIGFIYQRRKGKKQTPYGREKNECRRLSWDLKETIRKGDDPEKVHEYYNFIARMGISNYKNYLPTVGSTQVSYLLYAAKYGRKETVLYFLQRYLDGLFVFTPDTYGVDSNNENIMHLAMRRGWTDVVQKVLQVDADFFNDDDATNLAKSLREMDIFWTLKRNRMKYDAT